MAEQNITSTAQATAPTWLPAKFWNAKTGEVRVEQLARSYQELERMKAAPQAASLPTSAQDYQINVDHPLNIDDTVNQRMFDEGFTNAQAQVVYDMAGEHLMPMMQQIAQDADDSKHVDRLVQHFGGSDRLEALRPQLRAWGEANLGSDVFETLASTSDGVIAMHEMMKNREPGLNRGAQGIGSASEADLKRMMADPRYWREHDPSYVARVREGFRTLYPDGKP